MEYNFFIYRMLIYVNKFINTFYGINLQGNDYFNGNFLPFDLKLPSIFLIEVS